MRQFVSLVFLQAQAFGDLFEIVRTFSITKLSKNIRAVADAIRDRFQVKKEPVFTRSEPFHQPIDQHVFTFCSNCAADASHTRRPSDATAQHVLNPFKACWKYNGMAKTC